MQQRYLVMYQTGPCNWCIKTDTGYILQDDIKLGLLAEAEDYIKRYVSSFGTWGYKLLPMGEV